LHQNWAEEKAQKKAALKKAVTVPKEFHFSRSTTSTAIRKPSSTTNHSAKTINSKPAPLPGRKPTSAPKPSANTSRSSHYKPVSRPLSIASKDRQSPDDMRFRPAVQVLAEHHPFGSSVTAQNELPRRMSMKISTAARPPVDRRRPQPVLTHEHEFEPDPNSLNVILDERGFDNYMEDDRFHNRLSHGDALVSSFDLQRRKSLGQPRRMTMVVNRDINKVIRMIRSFQFLFLRSRLLTCFKRLIKR
jgi:hypothetical protein